MNEVLTNRERCLLRAIGMLKDRRNYYADACETPTINIIDGICKISTSDLTDGMCQAYDSATAILEYAWNENWEALNQFDYFGEEI